MVKYLHEINNEVFQKLADEKNKDNIESAKFLGQLAENKDDRRFNFSLLHLGMLMQIASISLEIKQDEIEGYLKLEKEETRTRKMEMIIKEINNQINTRYEFDKKTEIISCLYTHQGLGYICIEKLEFLKHLNEIPIDIETIENV